MSAVSEQSRGRARSGRRPGDSGTREAIRAAARAQFAEQGFDRTSMRSVALQAGVDPTLVSHFFGSKQKLFAEVMQLPFDPSAVIPRILAGDPAASGARISRVTRSRTTSAAASSLAAARTSPVSRA